jgi:hypothetical protein
MFSLYSTYSLKEDPNSGPSSTITLLQDVLDIDVHGFIINPMRFQIASVIYIPRKTNAVINMAPYISIDLNDERSCYAILLLHVPWPDGGEEFIVNQGSTAVQTLQEARKRPGDVPPYLENLLTKQKLSQEHLHDFVDQYDDQPTRIDLRDDETVENDALRIPDSQMDGDDSDEESFDEIAEAVEANVDEENAKGTVKSIDQATFQRFANCIKEREQRFKQPKINWCSQMQAYPCPVVTTHDRQRSMWIDTMLGSSIWTKILPNCKVDKEWPLTPLELTLQEKSRSSC